MKYQHTIPQMDKVKETGNTESEQRCRASRMVSAGRNAKYYNNVNTFLAFSSKIKHFPSKSARNSTPRCLSKRSDCKCSPKV